MARLRRLEVPGQTHYVIQRAVGGPPETRVFLDAADRQAFVDALRAAAAAAPVQVHAWALLPGEVQLLATPSEAGALGRFMQAVNRRYVSAHNRRHDRRGTVWEGRFRSGIVEGGALRLAALRMVDAQSDEPGITTAGQRTGGRRDGLIVDPPELWPLGNTPFERESAYVALLRQPVPAAVAQPLRSAALGGWVAGSAGFKARMAEAGARPAQPRPRGRPRAAARG